jgi:uncharacterized protein
MNNIARYQLPIFFFLAFAMTWTVQIPVYLYAHTHGYGVTNEANFFHGMDLLAGTLDPAFLPWFLLLTFSFGPTVAGISVTALFKGKKGLSSLFSYLIKVRTPLKWVIIIFAIPLGVQLIGLGLGYVMSGFQPIQYHFLVPLGFAIPFALYMIIFTGLAEELGWRGYALPELQKTYTAEKASWILGILWGLWHIPSNMFMIYLRGELTVSMAVGMLLGLTFGIVGWTIVLTWIYNNTQSLFWIVILHGYWNALQSYLILSSDNMAANAIVGVLPWVIAIYVLRRYGKETLTALVH